MAQGIRTVASLRAENVRLQAENSMLKRWRRRAEILESENIASCGVLPAPYRRKNGVPLTARAVTAPGGAFAHTVLVANGSDAGIEVGNPVVTADGLVGLVVVDVGKTYSRVLMISDINAQIPVILASFVMARRGGWEATAPIFHCDIFLRRRRPRLASWY